MKKSIFSKVAAAVVAGAMVLGMTVTAFAGGTIKSDLPNAADDGVGDFQVSISEWKGLDIAKIASFDIVLSWNGTEEDWMGGKLIVQSNSNGWNELGAWTTEQEGETFNGVVSGKVVHVDGVSFAADDEYAMVTVQNYGGLELSITGLALYDEAGNLLKSEGTVPSDEPEAPTEPDDNGNTESGDSAAATALILAAVAALAVAATVSVKKFAVER